MAYYYGRAIVILKSKLKMSFKSMAQYMKEQFWRNCWKSFGWRPRSQWKSVGYSSMETIDDSKQSCWATMLPELLTEILMRIEASESDWPARKNVVSCAGVCRSWRKNMKEIVKCPQISGKLTFPESLEQPGSVGSLTQCIIKKAINNEIYHLYLRSNKDPMHHDGKLLLSAKRVSCATCTEYIISYNSKDISKGSSSYLGIVRSNFLGTKFTIDDAHSPSVATKCRWPKVPAGNYAVSSVFYKVNALGNRSFELVACLDDDAGVKEHENIVLKFERYTRELSTMDYQYPISAFQAFATCLSTFDTKVACE